MFGDFFKGSLLFDSDPDAQLSRYMPPHLIGSIPENQRADYARNMKQQIALSLMSGSDPNSAISTSQQRLAEFQKAQAEQRALQAQQARLAAIFGVDPNTGGQQPVPMAPPAQNMAPNPTMSQTDTGAGAAELPDNLQDPTAPPKSLDNVTVTASRLPPLSNRKAQAAKYFKAAKMYAMSGDADKAKKYYDIGIGLDPNPSSEVRDLEYFGYEMEGAGEEAFGRLKTLNESKSSKVNVSTGDALTPGQRKMDEKSADMLLDWTVGGGFSDTTKQLTQLADAANALSTETGISNPLVQLVPDKALNVFNPRAVAVKAKVQEVVQRNLKLILGSQFTAQEGAQLIARAYDEGQPQSENLRRVNALRQQMLEAAQAKQDAAVYFQTHGTLRGWNGRMFANMSEFLGEYERRIGVADGGAGGNAGGWSIKPKGK
jgi:tetratricopeptide (TPR) repeat protein